LYKIKEEFVILFYHRTHTKKEINQNKIVKHKNHKTLNQNGHQSTSHQTQKQIHPNIL
jgi:hypothetical protein